jgi:hypothetical protein
MNRSTTAAHLFLSVRLRSLLPGRGSRAQVTVISWVSKPVEEL